MAAALLGCAVLLLAGTAQAAIVCQHPRKAKVVRLEVGPECRHKGWLKLVDLSGVADTVDGVAGVVADQIGTRCAQDPSRTLATTFTIDSPPAARHGCRRFDGDESGCNRAFESDGGTGVACWYLRGHCFPCDAATQATLACTNTCAPPQCPDDPARLYAGSTCEFLTFADCARHFASFGGFDSVLTTAAAAPIILGPFVQVAYACYWNGATCTACTDSEISAGRCVNACGAATCGARLLPNCFDATTPGDCALRFQRSSYTGLPVSCFWNGMNCVPCDLQAERLEKSCTNECP